MSAGIQAIRLTVLNGEGSSLQQSQAVSESVTNGDLAKREGQPND